MKPRPVDECLAASTDLIARTRSRLVQLQFSVDTCLSRIEISADAIAASQALLAKLDSGTAIVANSADGDFEGSPASEQTFDASPTTSADGAASAER